MRRKKPKEKELDPVIIEFRNQITGETKWRVYKKGWESGGRSIRSAPWIRDFDTREEAIECFAENFGWVADGERFQPAEPERRIVLEGELG